MHVLIKIAFSVSTLKNYRISSFSLSISVAALGLFQYSDFSFFGFCYIQPTVFFISTIRFFDILFLIGG